MSEPLRPVWKFLRIQLPLIAPAACCVSVRALLKFQSVFWCILTLGYLKMFVFTQLKFYCFPSDALFCAWINTISRNLNFDRAYSKATQPHRMDEIKPSNPKNDSLFEAKTKIKQRLSSHGKNTNLILKDRLFFRLAGHSRTAILADTY